MLPFPSPPAFTTRLSYPLVGFSRRGLFSALARLSLVAWTASMLSGCLIEDPPPYTQPAKTPPRLDLVRAFPSPDQIIVRNTGDVIPFSIPVVSEDAGDRLQAVLQLDMGSPTLEDDFVTSTKVPASTLDDVSRTLLLEYTVELNDDPGCHRFTVLVSHESNFGDGPEVVDPTDLAAAHWMANLNPETDGATLVNCPNASTGGP
jgi:hypothetical protein